MIPYFDYRPSLAHVRPEIEAAIARVLDSGRLILGPEVTAFEEELGRFVRAPHVVGVNSGTDALILALRALGVGVEDEVITVANAGVPPVAAIRAVGAVPRFVDVASGDLLLDPRVLEGALRPKTRAVLAVHLYGQSVDLEPVLQFTRRHGLRLIEDCAQAHGATYRGRHVGSHGDCGCFSFYPTKNLGAFGDGGAVVTADPSLARDVREQRMYGFRDDRHAHVEGLNSRLDELQAAILRVRLRHLDADNELRRSLARRYLRGLAGSSVQLPCELPERQHVFHLFVVQVAERRRVAARLEAAGIGYGLHYPEPVHRMEAYAFLGQPEGSLPITEEACRRVLSLPLYRGLDEASVDRVVAALRSS